MKIYSKYPLKTQINYDKYHKFNNFLTVKS